ncbi:PQQ-dependent sugar dehydrogenase [Pontibacter sp. G13]|uniref:PQQ-dependent sugar dehydrogenase n=1 Tax=Pontibacter sp. G13 TaxID=3074898 RepID=UPI00288A8F66|nr:PQQ-dependent sugar dehydrogenase [Pontibacter sp. G13]WNJ21345.1 PQQ-dependent sugar dehydrogenase [Pontibacter sp. G13]
MLHTFIACILFGAFLWAPSLHAQNPQPKTAEVSISVDTLVSDLICPWGMAFLPNGDLLFSERGGTLRVIKEGKLDPTPISGVPKVKAKGQGGFFDLALHPDFEENGWIYLTYAAPMEKGETGEGANTALMRARLENHALVDQEVLFKASPNYRKSHHYGGRIAFDHQGYLYLTIGDRGGRPEAQSLDKYRGKIIKLTDEGQIPSDNPFVNQPQALPEIYSYGHRNPQGLAVHPETGALWEHEHGPQGGDEINVVQAGANYGWPEITYGINYDNSIITKDTAKTGMEQPILYWRPSIAPCGMDFVASNRYGPWKGDLLVGSLKFRRLHRVILSGDNVVGEEQLLENIGRVRCVKQAPDGYIYLAIEGPGMIVKLIPESK